VELSADQDKLLANWLFHGLVLDQETGVKDLYEVALEMERRTRDHFRKLAGDLPAGLEKDLCGELAAEEEEHVALLEGELEGLG
jgi:rubrerythrin